MYYVFITFADLIILCFRITVIYSHANKACCWWWSCESLWVIMGCTLHSYSSPRDKVFSVLSGNLRSRLCVNRKPQNVTWLYGWRQVCRSRFTFQCVWPVYSKVNSRTAFLYDLNIENSYSKPKPFSFSVFFDKHLDFNFVWIPQ